MKVGKISKIDKHAGGNKAMQNGNFLKIDNLCRTFIRYSRVLTNERYLCYKTDRQIRIVIK